MASRRRGREIALQILCILDRQPDLDADEGLFLYFRHLSGVDLEGAEDAIGAPSGKRAPTINDRESASEQREFVEQLVHGVRDRLSEIDQLVTLCSRNWRLERMSWVDRNLLRLACHELTSCRDTPARVILNEAIEIARRYSTAESPGFINGVLDRAMRESGRRDLASSSPMGGHGAPPTEQATP